jgi:DNA polymerase-3 subunit epsilon
VSWLPSGLRRTPLAEARWAVIDCETSGLDPARDRLLSVGAVLVTGGRIEAGSAWQAFVAQAQPSDAANILIHGIGGDAQRSGRPPAEVIRNLESLAGEATAVAFHADFDATVLRRHGMKREWLDLAQLAPALYPARAARALALDDWLAAFDIPIAARHDALADAFATAQLFLVLLAEARRQGVASREALLRTARGRRWLAPVNL